jgi:hypothetical protein
MSIITATRRSVNPTRKTVVLFDGGRRHVCRDFGRGLLASIPTERRDHTAADEAWAADALNNRSDFPSDEVLDAMADESAALDRYTKGYCC